MKKQVPTPDYKALFQWAPGLFLVLEPDLTIAAVSDAYLKATMTEREDITGRNLFDVFPDNPADPTADGVRNLRASLERVLAKRAPDRMAIQKYDIRLPPEQGGAFEVRYWRPRNTPVLGPNGEVAYIIHQVKDVTELVKLKQKGVEQERVAAALRASKEWFSTTLNSIGDAVIAADVNRAVLFMNPVAEALTGWTASEAYGKPLSDIFAIVNEMTGTATENPAARVLETGHITGLANPTVLVARNGTERPIDDSAAPIVDERGHVAGVVVVFRDITDRKQAEQARRESEEKFRLLADAIPQLTWMAHSDGHIFWYNKQWYDYTGTTPEQMQGWGWQSVHDPEMLPIVVERWKASIATGEPFEMVFPLKGADGEYRPFLTRVNPVKDAGRVIRWFGTNTDITERQQAEQEIREQAERLREADRRKDEFLAMLAHELRNPLASVSNAIQILRKSNVPAEYAESSKEIIERQIKHLARLIDDLLDVSRITRGTIELRKERIDASPIINAAVEAVRPLTEEKKQELAVSFIPGTLWCEADPTRLEQILINLLTNATRYTPAGGHIRLAARREDGHVVFKVRDDGIGIPPDQLTAMFELFTQGDRTIARSEGGLGIGLTIVERIAQMHGGTATAHSEGTGKGSEFTVMLPPSSGRRPSPPANRRPASSRHGRRVFWWSMTT